MKTLTVVDIAAAVAALLVAYLVWRSECDQIRLESDSLPAPFFFPSPIQQ